MANDKERFDLELRTIAQTDGLERAEQKLRDVESAATDAAAASRNPMSMPREMLEPAEEYVEVLEETVEKTEEVAEAVEDRAERERQAQEDVDRAIARRAERERQAAAEEERQSFARIGRLSIYAAAINEVANIAGGELSNLLDQIEQIDPAMREQFAGADQLAQLLESPFRATLDNLKSLAGDVMNELAGDPRGAVAGLEAAAKQWERTRERIGASIRANIDAENTRLERQLSLLRELQVIDQANQDLEVAQADRRDAADLRGGVAPELVETRRIQEDAAREIRNIQKELTDAESALDALKVNSAELAGDLREAQNQVGQEDVVAEIQQQLQSNAAARAQAQAEISTLISTERTRIEEVVTRASADLDAIGAAADEGFTESTASLLETIQAKAGETSEQGKQYVETAMAQLSQTLADGVVEASEQALVIDALARLRQAQESRDTAVAAALQEITQRLETNRILYDELRAGIQAGNNN